MEISDLLPYIFAILTGVSSWFSSYFMATKKSKQDLQSLEKINKHDLEKLMKQHEIDIESLKEKHSLEIKSINNEHKNKLEIIKLEHENELSRKSQEIEKSATFGAIEKMLGNTNINDVLKLLDNPQFQKHIKNK